MIEPESELYEVPDVIGLPFHVGRDLAEDHGVTFANPDPDGPPISALAWPSLFYIVSQNPPAGTRVTQWSSVGVEIVEHGDESQLTEPHDQPAPRPPQRASAEAEDEQH